MNEYDQESAIAWHCGLRGEGTPSYLNDLNAMREAGESLTEAQMIQYHFQLFRMAESPLTNKERIMGGHFILQATAAQRAEAFLKALNLWK